MAVQNVGAAGSSAQTPPKSESGIGPRFLQAVAGVAEAASRKLDDLTGRNDTYQVYRVPSSGTCSVGKKSVLEGGQPISQNNRSVAEACRAAESARRKPDDSDQNCAEFENGTARMCRKEGVDLSR